jgi:hypothetical protein
MARVVAELWTVDEALADLPALDADIGKLARARRPAAAARWFAARYGKERGAAVFVLYVRLMKWMAQHQSQSLDRERMRLALALVGARGGGAVDTVPQPIPPDDKPEA